MVLPSNSCPNTQPNNVAGKYIVDVQNEIKLDGDWEVALTEFSFTFLPSVIEKGVHITYYKKQPVLKSFKYNLDVSTGVLQYDLKIGEGDIGFNVKVQDGKIKFSNDKQLEMTLGFYDKYTANMYGFNEMYMKGKELIADKPYNKHAQRTIIRFQASPEEYVPHTVNLDENLIVETNEKTAEKLKSEFSAIFSNVEIDNNLLSFNVNNNNIGKVVFEPTFAKLLGLDKAEFDTSVNKKFIASQQIKAKIGQNHMYIYLSIIEPILVGDTYAPLLKTIWLEHEKYKPGDVVTVTPKIPMYIPVSSSSINNIEVNIRSDNGNIIDFGYGAKSVLTLHFRKK